MKFHFWTHNESWQSGWPPKRSIFWQGRAHLEARRTERSRALTLGWEWAFWRFTLRWPYLHLELNGYDDSSLGFSICLPFLFYFHWHLRIPGWRGPGEWRQPQDGTRWWMPEERQIGLNFHDGTLWIDLWNNPNESASTDPWWWHISITPADILLGRHVYSERVLGVTDGVIGMPEGDYPATLKFFESTWQRPRWPWPKHLRRVTVTPEIPVPIPGSGESESSIGDDSINSSTFAAPATVTEACAHVALSAMRDRRRYAAPDWTPRDGWPVKAKV